MIFGNILVFDNRALSLLVRLATWIVQRHLAWLKTKISELLFTMRSLLSLDNFFQCLSWSTFPPIHMTKNHAILFFSLVPHINLLFNAILVWVKGFPLGIKLSPFLSVINICGVINNMKSNQQQILIPSFCSILLTLIFYHIGWLLPLFFLSPNRKREKRDEAVWEFPYVTVLFFFNCIVEWNKLHSFPCAKTSKVCLIISSFFSNIQKHLKLVIKLYVWDVLKF